MSYEIIINHNFINTDFSLNFTQTINLPVEYFNSIQSHHNINNIVNNIMNNSIDVSSIFAEIINENQPKKLVYNREKFGNLEKASESCPICFEKFRHDEEVCVLECNHVYHTHCIDKWGQKKQTCPICRKNIPLS